MDKLPKTESLLSKILKGVVPLIVTVGLCWLMFSKIDYREMLHIIRTECNFTWIALALFVSIFSHVFRAMRWNIQLEALDVHAPKFNLILSIFGTYAINLIFPRLGELWRSSYIAQRQKAPFSTVFGSMIADRLADTATVLLIAIVVFLLASSYLLKYFASNDDSYQQIIHLITSPWLWLGIVAVIAAIWLFLKRPAKPGSGLAKIKDFLRGLWKGFAVLATMPHKGAWLFWTVALWGCYFLQLYITFFAFPFTAQAIHEHGIVCALVIFVIESVAMGVPSNGGIGPWQWAVMYGLSLYGVDKTDGLAYANLVLGTSTLLLILLGIFTFICIMLDRKRIAKAQKEIS